MIAYILSGLAVVCVLASFVITWRSNRYVKRKYEEVNRILDGLKR